MHASPLPSLSKASLALALVFAAACDNQVTPPTVRPQPSEAIRADKAPFKNVFALEPLPGSIGGASFAYGINDLGQIVGQSSTPTGYRAVIWDNSNVPEDLGIPVGSLSSLAAAISNDGQVIAGTVTDASSNTHPVRWLKANGQWLPDVLLQGSAGSCSTAGMSPNGSAIVANCTNIGFDPIAAVWLNGSRINLGVGYVNGVNDKGQAVGVDASFTHALLWTFGAGPVTVIDLGTLGGVYAVANSINDAGEVTGWSERADHESHAFLWSLKKNTMVDLGAVGGTSGGYGINSAGQVVGDVWPNSIQHGGFFDHGKVVDLGVLPGYQAGIAFRLNNNGVAVGYSYNTSGSFPARATKWILK